MRCRPFTTAAAKLLLCVQVKDLLSRHALQSFARSAHATLMQHVSVLTDEHLKREDRKTMQEITKTLETLLHSAKLPEAERALVDFSLALALKCMRAQNLERRLFGLHEIKERIALSIRRFEYFQSQVAQTGKAVPLQAEEMWTTPDFLVDWLLREQVVELIFGEALHDQVHSRLGTPHSPKHVYCQRTTVTLRDLASCWPGGEALARGPKTACLAGCV